MERNKFLIFLQTIWPTIYKIINKLFYFILNSLKKIISLIIDQIKGI